MLTEGNRMVTQDQPSAEFFLKDEAFKARAFSGQKSELFSPSASELKSELMKVLVSIYSDENLEFLNDVHALNSQRNLSPQQLQVSLAAIEKKYIATNAPNLINIQSSAINKILNSKDKSLADYQDAVKEVFKLISDNVKGAKPELKEKLAKLDDSIEIKNLQRSANDLAADFNNLIAVVVTKPTLMEIVRHVNRDATLMISCQDVCKTAQRELRQIARDSVDPESCKTKMAEIFDKTKERLATGCQQLQEFETKTGKQPVFSDAIKDMIKAIDSADVKVNFSERSTSSRSNSTTVKLDSPTEDTTPESSMRMRRH
jgi:hypothetical protein